MGFSFFVYRFVLYLSKTKVNYMEIVAIFWCLIVTLGVITAGGYEIKYLVQVGNEEGNGGQAVANLILFFGVAVCGIVGILKLTGVI